MIKGHGYSYVVRTCSVDTGSGRMDEEIVRVSHCGYMSLENFYGLDNLINKSNSTDNVNPRNNVFKGCLSVCNYDECNSAFCVPTQILSLNFLMFISLYYYYYS